MNETWITVLVLGLIAAVLTICALFSRDSRKDH